MKWIVALAALLVLVIGAFVGYGIYEEMQSTRYLRETHTARMQDLQYERAERRAELDAATEPMMHSVAAIAGALLLLAVSAGIAGGIYIALQRAHRRATFVMPTADGLLPMPLDPEMLAHVGALALQQYHQTQHAAASRQPVPAHLHVEIEQVASPAVQSLPADVAAGEPSTMPGPVDMANIAFVPTLHSLLLGLRRDGSQIVVPGNRLMHVALSGATDSGKSNIGRLILAQFLSCGVECGIADPKYTHYDAETGEDWRPIAARLAHAPAVKPDDIAVMLDWLALEELERRLELRRNGQRYGNPFVLYLDELPSIVENVKHATDRISSVLRMGRAVGLFLVGASQDFLVKTIGGSSGARDCYKTAFYGGGDLIGARSLLDMRQKDIEEVEGSLGKGVVLLRCASQPTPELSRVPLMSNESLYKMLPLPEDTPTIEIPNSATVEYTGTGSSGDTDAVCSGTVSGSDNDLIVELVRRGLSANKIVEIVGGTRANVLRRVKELKERVQ